MVTLWYPSMVHSVQELSESVKRTSEKARDWKTLQKNSGAQMVNFNKTKFKR